jgi:NAD-dependent deacetylase
MPYHMDHIWDLLRAADIFAAIGTSGQVYPAAAFVQDADRAGAHTVEINLEPSATVSDFAETRFGMASVEVPAWVTEILGG